MNHSNITAFTRSAGVLLCATLSTLGAAQDAPPTPLEKLTDAIVPQSAGLAKDFGVKDIRGQLRLYGKSGLDINANDGPKLTVNGGAALDVRFLGAMREALAVEAKYEIGLRSPSGRERSNAVASRAELEARSKSGLTKVVRMCGFTVELNDTSAQAKKRGPKDLLPGGVTASFMVGPVPVLIQANAGVGLEVGAAPFLETSDHLRLGLEGSVGAYLNGWVIAGVGAGCRFASVVAGVKGDLKLMDVSSALRLGIDTQDGPFAQVRYKLLAASLRILAIASAELRVGWLKIGKTFEYLLYQWSSTPIEGTIPVLGG